VDGGWGMKGRNGMGGGASPSRTLLRYYGGKWLLAPWILGHMPRHRVYVEPFGGGGSVLLRKGRSFAEVYGDLDGQVVNLFRVVRDRGEELRRQLEMTPFSRAEYEGSFEETDDPMEWARRTLVRSFMGFGSDSLKVDCAASGFRSDTKRGGSTPCRDWWRYPDRLPALMERLRGVVIECRDAVEVIPAHDGPDTVMYVDPPYVPSTRTRPGAHGYNHELTEEQHRGLAELLHGVQGKVMLSGYASGLYEELYGDWRREERATHADGAQPRRECLWMNFEGRQLTLGLEDG
jgi:DNA adenine methylase